MVAIVKNDNSISNAEKDKPATVSSDHLSLANLLNLSSDDLRKTRPRPLVSGHRGSPYHSIENTRDTFLHCESIGCDSVELDVFLLKCGTLVVFHGGGTDRNPGLLKQYCNVEGSILDLTALEARKLRFNPDHEEFGCGPEYIKSRINDIYIPTLEEVLTDLKGTGIVIKIELKGPGTTEPVLNLVDKMDMIDQCHYISFDHSKLKRVRELHPERNSDGTHVYKTGCVIDYVPDNLIEVALDIGASEIHLKYSTCKPELIKRIHNAGMDSVAWFPAIVRMTLESEKYCDVGNEDAAMFRVVMATGVKAMCVNKTDDFIKIVGPSPLHSKS